MANWFAKNAPPSAPQNPLPSSGSRTAPPTGTPPPVPFINNPTLAAPTDPRFGTPDVVAFLNQRFPGMTHDQQVQAYIAEVNDPSRAQTINTGRTAPSVQPNQAVGQGVNGTQDYAAVIAELQKQFPATPEGFKQLLQALNARGIPAMAASHANGTQASDDKIVLPNGTYYDIRNDNGWNAPGQALHWDPSVPVFNAQGQSQNYNDVLKAQGLPTFQFTPGPEDGPVGGGQGGGTLQNPGGYATGSFMEPWNFKAPTDVTEQNDPGFQFRLKEGLNAIQKSAAAKGTLLTGGTLKDLAEFGQNFASNEYDKVYGRALGEYEGSLGLKQNQFGNLFSLSQQGLQAASGQNQQNSSYNQNTNETNSEIANTKANSTIGTANTYLNAAAPLIDWYRKRGMTAPNPTDQPTANASLKGA